MKKNIMYMLFIMLGSTIGLKAFASDIELANADGMIIYYNYSRDSTELTVTYGSNKYQGDVVIPEEVQFMDRKLQVTSIGERAFYRCEGLTSVTIPNSVVTIGDSGFCGCRALSSIIIPNGVTTIGQQAFSDCRALSSVTIPSSVSSIGQGALWDNSIKTIISKIENPFSICGKGNSQSPFSVETYNNAKLYVPVGTIDKYIVTDGWKDFMFIDEEKVDGVATYESLLLDGKMWKMEEVILPPDSGEHYNYEDLVLHDDTLINDILFKRAYIQSVVDGEQALYPQGYWIGQKNGCVYQYEENEESEKKYYPIMDFSLNVSDEFSLYAEKPNDNVQQIQVMEKYRVTAVSDTVLVRSTDKRKRRCLYVQSISSDAVQDCWVEGIGSLKYGIIGRRHLSGGSSKRLVQCSRDGVVLYRPKEIVSTNDNDRLSTKFITTPDYWSTEVGAPIVATQGHTFANMLYNNLYMLLMPGDLITQIAFKGYNEGHSFTRHIIVWMCNYNSYDNGGDKRWISNKDNMTRVFEGDCTIAAGGSADEHISLLNITLDTPLEYTGNSVQVIIESTGDPVGQDICFEHAQIRWYTMMATADRADEQVANADYSAMPIARFTVTTPVINLTGTVSNQDKKPIPNAMIQLQSIELKPRIPTIYTCWSDDDGHYALRIDDGNKGYVSTVSAPGCATYTGAHLEDSIKESSKWDFMLYDAVEYKAGRRATIIMPVTPDPSAGRYFRMDRTENGKVVFEREFSPQANVPYVIFPDRDFIVDLKPLDLTMDAGKTSVNDVDFIGTYTNYNVYIYENQKLLILDETPDVEYEFSPSGGRIAALRACIIEAWWYDDDVVFHDDTDGVSPTIYDAATDAIIYDLQGRRLNAKPEKGIYIQNGKKYVTK